jgi:hypothetical protein
MNNADTISQIGKRLAPTQQRDAVHIAVCPVRCTEHFLPGEHVGIKDGKAIKNRGGSVECVGILDPFMPHCMVGDEYVFVFLYPGSITSLRHEWTHPKIDAPIALVAAAPAPVNDRAVSEAWLRQYAKRVNSYFADNGDQAYETLMEDIRGGTITYHGTDMHSFGELQDADELQHHASIVLGRQVNWGEFEYFSCSC